MEYATEFQISDVISYLVTLYAVVPSIVITMMYSFLSEIEGELPKLSRKIDKYNRSEEDKQKLKRAESNVSRFIIISSKIFHLSMAYYLVMLFCSLLSKCCAVDQIGIILFMMIGTLGYFVYFIFYTRRDIYPSVKDIFNNEVAAARRWMAFIVIFYGVFPVVFGFIHNSAYREVSIHITWITVTMGHLMIWWLILPFIYKPLTNLTYIKKRIG